MCYPNKLVILSPNIALIFDGKKIIKPILYSFCDIYNLFFAKSGPYHVISH